MQTRPISQFLWLATLLFCHATAEGIQDRGYSGRGPGGGEVVNSQTFAMGAATIRVDFAAGDLDLKRETVVGWVRDAAKAITVYYGRFPVATARVLIVPVADRHGVLQGTTWGDMRGFPGFTRMRIGQHTTQKELTDDWTMTHELSHMAFPGLQDDQHWMEEGLATYVEPIARVQAGQLASKKIWQDMMEGMPKGEPRDGDQGLNRTHTWGRTYWGGALFCLMADVEIRKETKNRKGLQDALRAIVAGGGSIDQDWPIERALAIGDQATGTQVLSGMYSKWGTEPVEVDLAGLWKELGVKEGGESVDGAPLAAVRRQIIAGQ